MTIESFGKDTEYFFMSSMFPLEHGVETPDGVVVDSVEIGYQADKFVDQTARQKVLTAPNGYAAKSIAKHLETGEGVPKRPDWDEIKVDVMRWYVRQKFTRNPDVAKKLLETGDEELVEGNHWKDTFWGVSPRGSRNGQNWLGRILMEMREELRDQPHANHSQAS